MGELIADVKLPRNARVYREPCGTKYKADRIILSNLGYHDGKGNRVLKKKRRHKKKLIFYKKIKPKRDNNMLILAFVEIAVLLIYYFYLIFLAI